MTHHLNALSRPPDYQEHMRLAIRVSRLERDVESVAWEVKWAIRVAFGIWCVWVLFKVVL
jgi:hypothetical protein